MKLTKRHFLLGGIAAILALRRMPAIVIKSALGGRFAIESSLSMSYTAQDYV